MSSPRTKRIQKYILLLGIMLALPLIGLLILGIDGEHHFNTLPYYSAEGTLEERTPDAQRVGSFSLTNQEGESFESERLVGKVWIAAFYSTNAPHVAQMTRQLLWSNFRYRDEDDIYTVCFTLDPDHDQPAELKAYVDQITRYNGPTGKWQFLTGEPSVIDALVSESFMIQRDPEDPNNIATLWLVDSEGYLRGLYHAASEDAIRDAVEDIALLQKELDEAAYARRKARESALKQPPLPVLGPEGHTIPPFALQASDSSECSHYDVANKLRIVDFFFTRCPSICPILSSQLARVQGALEAKGMDASEILLLSHSVDPVHDTPSVLKAYADRLGAKTEQWKFLTGAQEDIYDLARNGYFLTALESDTAAGGYFHSDLFALIDRQGQIRGYYDGTETDEVDQMVLDAEQLWFLDE